MKRLIGLVFAALLTVAAHAADVKISALPAGSALAGTEAVPAVQSGATVQTSPSAIGTYLNSASGTLTNKTISGSSNTLSAIGLSSLASQSNNTVLGNISGSSAAPSALNPGQIQNMVGTVLSAVVATTANITLSGLQAIDGWTTLAGDVVLVTGQTTASQNGLWIAASGAWTRSPNMPTGLIIPVGCQISVYIQRGTLFHGYSAFLPITVSPLTVGTSSLSFTILSPNLATTSVSGAVTISTTARTKVASIVSNPQASGNCVTFADSTGGLSDPGDVATGISGPCVFNTHNHLLPPGVGGTTPTTNHGTMDTNSTDNRGVITALSAVTSVTVTFVTAFDYPPSCGGSTSAATAVGVSSIGGSNNTVTFSMAALTGTLYWYCW